MDKTLTGHLAALLGVPEIKWRPLSGGDISQSFQIEAAGDRYFCKSNKSPGASEMFLAEKRGLEAIAASRTIKTPAVVHCGTFNDTAFLLLEFIESKGATDPASASLGDQLANLHNPRGGSFGGLDDNFIGSLPQSNKNHSQWAEFYCVERLLPQFRLGQDKGLLNGGEIPSEQKLGEVVSDLTISVAPSLLHGDLWAGNYLISQAGEPFLIDPAVYFGHSEVDLAMTRLFGGFSNSFYKAYQEVRPLQPGWQERQDIYQLYYLLVHLNLFGRSYYPRVKEILRRHFY